MLGNQANDRRSYLDSLTIITGQHVPATGQANGDCLTGNGSAAEVIYPANKTLAEIHADVMQNLKKSGYTTWTDLKSNASSGIFVTGITTSATDQSGKTLQIRYSLKTRYACDGNQTDCTNSTTIIKRAKLEDAIITFVTVDYQ